MLMEDMKMKEEMDINTTTQNVDKGGKKGCVMIIIAWILFFAWMIFTSSDNTGGSNSSSSSKECPICSREFSDSSNRRSIRRTGMCSTCYKNYKTANEMLGY